MCKDKVAIVMGASGSGMGRSIALTLAREGAKVVVNYLTSEERANAVVEHIESQGGAAVAIQANVFETSDCTALVQESVRAFGQVDICIVSPGAGWHTENIDRLASADALRDVVQEVAPLYYLMPLVVPEMYNRKWGRIIGISVHPTKLPPAYAYNAAKAARAEALRLAADEAWSRDVTVNNIAPGPVTSISTLEEAIEQCQHGPAWQKRKNTSPQDIGEAVAFLCSEQGRFISGCTLPFMFY